MRFLQSWLSSERLPHKTLLKMISLISFKLLVSNIEILKIGRR